MTYDGALVMPRNCVAMSEEEMTYVEGGDKSINTLYNNLVGLVKTLTMSGAFSGSLKGTTVTAGLGALLKHTLTWAISWAVTTFGAIGAAFAGAVGLVIAWLGITSAINYLAGHRVFY